TIETTMPAINTVSSRDEHGTSRASRRLNPHAVQLSVEHNREVGQRRAGRKLANVKRCNRPDPDIATLFDHLVGDGERAGRCGESESLRRLEVNSEIKPCRLFNWKIGWR